MFDHFTLLSWVLLACGVICILVGFAAIALDGSGTATLTWGGGVAITIFAFVSAPAIHQQEVDAAALKAQTAALEAACPYYSCTLEELEATATEYDIAMGSDVYIKYLEGIEIRIIAETDESAVASETN